MADKLTAVTYNNKTKYCIGNPMLVTFVLKNIQDVYIPTFLSISFMYEDLKYNICSTANLMFKVLFCDETHCNNNKAELIVSYNQTSNITSSKVVVRTASNSLDCKNATPIYSSLKPKPSKNTSSLSCKGPNEPTSKSNTNEYILIVIILAMAVIVCIILCLYCALSVLPAYRKYNIVQNNLQDYSM